MENRINVLELFNILRDAYKNLSDINNSIGNLSGRVINEELTNSGLGDIEVSGYRLIKDNCNKLVVEYRNYNSDEGYLNPNNYISEKTAIIRNIKGKLSFLPLDVEAVGDCSLSDDYNRSLNIGFIYKLYNKKVLKEIFDKLEEMDPHLPLIIMNYRGNENIYSFDGNVSKSFSVESEILEIDNSLVSFEITIVDGKVVLIYNFMDSKSNIKSFMVNDNNYDSVEAGLIAELASKVNIRTDLLPVSIAAYANCKINERMMLKK